MGYYNLGNSVLKYKKKINFANHDSRVKSESQMP